MIDAALATLVPLLEAVTLLGLLYGIGHTILEVRADTRAAELNDDPAALAEVTRRVSARGRR